jgi:Pregnancy-associated plasma protein-A
MITNHQPLSAILLHHIYMQMTTRFSIFVFLICTLLASGCAPKLTQYVPDPAYLVQEKATQLNSYAPKRVLETWQDYIPDTNYLRLLPMRQVRVNFHIMLPSDTTKYHIAQERGRSGVLELYNAANADLDTNPRNWRSPEGTAVLPRRYRYKLWPQANDDGIYFHQDDALYHYVVSGANQNNYDQTVIEKYGIGLDSILNVFIQPHHPDSLKSKTYRASGQAIALGLHTKLSGIFELGHKTSDFRGMFNHEVGHILGLGHAWSGDGCPDTEDHANQCYEWKTEGPCYHNATNNMMDYNAYEIAVTPCQIGKMHQQMSNEAAQARNILVRDWCKIALPPIVIQEKVTWVGQKDLVSEIIIESGGVLKLKGRLSMPEGARILVRAGGVLLLDGCKLHNSCGKKWRGIQTEKGGTVEVFHEFEYITND